MDELDHQKIFNKIIYKQLEPCVLNEEVIRNSVLEQGPRGEAGRIFKNMEIQYEKVTVLRLEFLNILKIDHLWILPNIEILSLAFNKIDKIENLETLSKLKELNLAFNSIEKLENLECLQCLEILNIFGNKIRKIENVDRLENLIIFSAGNNLIDTKDGLERLRFLKSLRSLNLKGNEIEKNDKHFRLYLAGLLPDLSYYEYRHINKRERENGRDRYRFRLREIMDNEKAEVLSREDAKRTEADNVHHTACFVENLDGHELFDSLFNFENEEQGECLLKIGEEAQTLITEFREQSFAVTQKIYKIGLEEFDKRKAEEELFRKCVAMGKRKIQVLGQNIINDFLEQCGGIFEQTREISAQFQKTRNVDVQNGDGKEAVDKQITTLMEQFRDLFDATWKSLMESEMQINESVNSSNSTFEHVIQDMMNEFIEKCKTEFVELREIESNFIDALTEAVQSFVTLKAATGKEDEIPEELRESLVERDIILNYAAGMREMHTHKIDGREDVLLNRGMHSVKDLCEKMFQSEIDRNRLKVMEINYFLDKKQSEFDELTTDIFHDPDIDTIDTVEEHELNTLLK